MMTTLTSPLQEPLISEDLLASLKESIDSRRIERGMNRLRGCNRIFEAFNPSLKNAATFLGCLAEWCDVGYGDRGLVKRLLATYDKESGSRLPISEYVYVLMARGMVAMNDEMLDSAINHFDTVLKLADEMNAWDILAISHHWIARCQRKRGQYESALVHIRSAREIQATHGHVQNEAPARVLESLILFEKGQPRQAAANLRATEAVLTETDDYVTLGNIQSTYGRIMQRELRYGMAIKHYAQAIEQFQKRDSKHPNVARALVDMSFTRILVARHLRHNLERCANEPEKNKRSGPARAELVKELSNLYGIILATLDQAAVIYRRHSSVRGVARVDLYRGYLHLDMGQLDLAVEDAGLAYVASESKRDFILMASARNLQCMVENARVDEEVEGWADHALTSQDCAGDAVELASNTQDRRLLAIVHIWQGLTFSNAFFNARDAAREAMDRASTYIDSSVRDYIWEDFQTLRRRVLENASLQPRLIQWAQGEIGDRTFRQLEDDFADMVIPVTWNKEKRKVSRVAARLSISPKKVRRVLTRLGLLSTGLHSGSKRMQSLDGERKSHGIGKRVAKGSFRATHGRVPLGGGRDLT